MSYGIIFKHNAEIVCVILPAPLSGAVMRPYVRMFLVLIFAFVAATAWAEVPYQIGPFALGRPIGECEKYVNMETALPVRYMEYVQEAEIRHLNGFKSGLIAFITCEKPERIVRIKLKYEDNSRKFYNNLIKQIENKYGKSDEYRGDPFHVVVAWKWSFVDKQNNKISLIVQHNTRDEDEKMGNSIKLTLTSDMDKYEDCYEKKLAEKNRNAHGATKEIVIPGMTGWDLFVPRADGE